MARRTVRSWSRTRSRGVANLEGGGTLWWLASGLRLSSWSSLGRMRQANRARLPGLMAGVRLRSVGTPWTRRDPLPWARRPGARPSAFIPDTRSHGSPAPTIGADGMVGVSDQGPTYSSANGGTGSLRSGERVTPPTSSTRPSPRGVAVWPERAAAIVPAGLKVPDRGSHSSGGTERVAGCLPGRSSNSRR